MICPSSFVGSSVRSSWSYFPLAYSCSSLTWCKTVIHLVWKSTAIAVYIIYMHVYNWRAEKHSGITRTSLKFIFMPSLLCTRMCEHRGKVWLTLIEWCIYYKIFTNIPTNTTHYCLCNSGLTTVWPMRYCNWMTSRCWLKRAQLHDGMRLLYLPGSWRWRRLVPQVLVKLVLLPFHWAES